MTIQAQQKSKVITLLVAVVVFFAVLYLPDQFLDLSGKKMEAVGKILTKTVGTAAISALLMWILFVIDHLPNGKGLKSKFFVYCRPSNRAVAECKGMNLDQAQADALWYPFWNSLAAREPADNLRRYYEESFTHSYGCRFIFYFVPLLVICIVSSLASIVLCTWVLRIWPGRHDAGGATGGARRFFPHSSVDVAVQHRRGPGCRRDATIPRPVRGYGSLEGLQGPGRPPLRGVREGGA